MSIYLEDRNPNQLPEDALGPMNWTSTMPDE